MKNLRTLTLALMLLSFCATASAQQGGNDCTPGNTQSPPCAAANVVSDDPSADETPTTVTTQTTTSEIVTTVTIELIETLLSIF